LEQKVILGSISIVTHFENGLQLIFVLTATLPRLWKKKSKSTFLLTCFFLPLAKVLFSSKMCSTLCPFVKKKAKDLGQGCS